LGETLFVFTSGLSTTSDTKRVGLSAAHGACLYPFRDFISVHGTQIFSTILVSFARQPTQAASFPFAYAKFGCTTGQIFREQNFPSNNSLSIKYKINKILFGSCFFYALPLLQVLLENYSYPERPRDLTL
jgi:hypothetical protein